ncbi:ABC transporter ATP-binding protein/permease [Streptomyces sp. RY43-2]|uniref:ABC transporter ATP-binding protein/permease n=1 Tax=Streptomyces macrolidinus TaxID=2952607 RepID=A0ABT0ZIG6_9ACTN|nr:ABC transporter ATP-binding protein [Streptomyces macrolidinus]MCN9243373.1 ABC transporter ATP-binding protein/permease [Streptomyces macrolidinus]
MAERRKRDLLHSAVFAVRLAWLADRRALVHVIVVQVLSAMVMAGALVMTQQVFGAVLARGPAAAGRSPVLVPAVIAALVVGAAVGALRLSGTARMAVLTVKVDRLVAGMVLEAAVAAELPRFEEPDFHDRLQRAVFASRRQPALAVILLVTAFQAALTVLAVGGAFVLMAWWLLPLVLLSAVPAIRAAGNERSAHHDMHHGLSENRRLREYLERLLTGRDEAKEIRALDLGGVLTGRWQEQYAHEVRATEALMKTHARHRMVAQATGGVVICVLVGSLWWLATSDLLPLSTAGAAVAGVWLLSVRLNTFAGMLGGIGENLLRLTDLETFIAPTSATARVPRQRRELTYSQLPCEPVALRAERLTFTYPGAEVPAVHEVSLDLRPGQVVALVGVNGSGKTTLAHLLAGLYPPDGGHLLCDGAPVTDLTAHRERTAVVFQDFTRYKLPALDNIAFGRPHTTDDLERVQEAARQAGALDFLKELPDSLHTPLGKEFTGGADLSGGQWQRLALARAFYRDAPLVILDEPTAALDAHAEDQLFAHLRRLFTGRTVVLISHRLRSVRHADRIYVLETGRVVEQGSHETLLRTGGAYATLFRAQARAYQNTGTS